MNNTRKCIKGIYSRPQCRESQYEEGKTYTIAENELSISYKGFHAIDENDCPLYVFDCCAPSIIDVPARYFKVEIGGAMQKNAKIIRGTEMRIGAEIGILGLVKAHVEWVKKHIKKEGKKHDTEDYSSASNTGNQSSASNTGAYSYAEVSGKESVAAVFGECGKARGALGCWLVLTERGEFDYFRLVHPIIGMKAVKVDGKEIKPDTWYELKDGKVVEAEPENPSGID